MKLQHIPIGGRFEYEGKVFVKTGPLTASAEHGGQMMIPRYAILKPLDLPAMESKPGSRRKLDESTVKQAFNEFCLTCSALIDEPSRPALDAARQRFLAALR